MECFIKGASEKNTALKFLSITYSHAISFLQNGQHGYPGIFQNIYYYLKAMMYQSLGISLSI